MTLTVYGDFNCPYSYLASQRVDALQRLGFPVEWRAVEHDPQLPVTGRPSSQDAPKWVRELDEVASLARPDELVPSRMPKMVSNSRAAVSAYAEAVTDDVHDQVRRGLFKAVWEQGLDLSSGYAVRPIVAAATWPHTPVDEHQLAPDLPMPVDERPGAGESFRLFGATVDPEGEPLTTRGYRRIQFWREDWLALPDQMVPAVVDEGEEPQSGVAGLAFLSRLLDRTQNT